MFTTNIAKFYECFRSPNFSLSLIHRSNKLFLNPRAKANPKAVKAILRADLIVVGPGNFYCSIIPNLLVKGIPEAIKKSKAIKIYNCNLMTKYGHTDGFSVKDFTNVVENYLGKNVLDYIIFNTKEIPTSLSKKYSSEGEIVRVDKKINQKRFIGRKLINSKLQFQIKDSADKLKRTLIRHDSDKLAKTIISLI